MTVCNPGSYWDRSLIRKAVKSGPTWLSVIAPEARFGAEAPSALPGLPWASRPQLPHPNAATIRTKVRGALFPGSHIDPYVLPAADAYAAVGLGKLPLLCPPSVAPTRFVGTTPLWFERFDNYIRETNHVPSGYGVWEYAWLAHRLGGTYCFYPTRSHGWLDACPFDVGLASRLAPDLSAKPDEVRPTSTAVRVLRRAMAQLARLPFWRTHVTSRRGDPGAWTTAQQSAAWGGETLGCKRMPIDGLPGEEPSILARDLRSLGDVLRAYEEAWDVLGRGLEERNRGGGAARDPRGHADLLLARFWTALSLFHLRALQMAAEDGLAYVRTPRGRRTSSLYPTYIPCFRMSDCLDAYDGHHLDIADETRHSPWVPGRADGYQGHILEIPPESPDYRARRHLHSVLGRLRPELVEDARRLLGSATDVMKDYGRTAWGWSVYYTDVYTFFFRPIVEGWAALPRPTGPIPLPTTPLPNREGPPPPRLVRSTAR